MDRRQFASIGVHWRLIHLKSLQDREQIKKEQGALHETVFAQQNTSHSRVSALGFLHMRVLIIGCGYVGLALGQLLARSGHLVWGLRRGTDATETMRKAGIQPLQGDITHPDSLTSLPDALDAVVNLVSSSKGAAAEYREVYLGGTHNLIRHFSQSPLQRYIHTSSTSVYGQADGSWVDEESPALPSGETSRLLLETESTLLQANATTGFPGIIVRASGIYGPDRGHLFRQFARGEARAIGDGSRWINMIHRDDLASALAVAIERGVPGQVYNANDDAPVQEREFFEWLVRSLHRPYPAPAEPDSVSKRKRGLTSKRVRNQKLRDLGWNPQYPTFREGYASDIQAVLQGTDPSLLGTRPD